MDFFFKCNLKTFILFCLLLAITIESINAQLNSSDINYIKRNLLALQDETTGLFEKSVVSTYKSVFTLITLNETINNLPKICREISFEAMNAITVEIVQLNTLLDCKLTITPPLNTFDDNSISSGSLEEVYNRVTLAHLLNATVNWGLLFDNVKAFINSDSRLFTNLNGKSELSKSSLLSTAHGLRLLTLIYENFQGKPDDKQAVKEQIKVISDNLIKEFQNVKEETGFFSEHDVSTVRLNSAILSVLPYVNAASPIDKFEEIMSRIVNYLTEYKYANTSVNNIYYLIRGLKAALNIPILNLEKNVFDYVEEKTIGVKFTNAFGMTAEEYPVLLRYKLIPGNGKKEDVITGKGEYDLEEDVEEKKEVEEPTGMLKMNTLQNNVLDLSILIKSPGKYIVDIYAEYTVKKMGTIKTRRKITTEGGEGKEIEEEIPNVILRTFTQKYQIPINSMSKIKLNHLKMSVANSPEKSDEKEITVEYPKRSFKNIKANEKSIIKLKVRLNYGDNQVNKIEQFFLRLRHVELGKTYSAYVREYKAKDDYHYINFEMSDPNTMEAYGGLYELTLIVSDAGLENPMIWNFGKLEIKFQKALDPSNLAQSYKSPQKEKMEPSFPVEQSANKNIVVIIYF